eukprot:6203996-Pleurochrysis_carterae.AAC.1
MQKQSFDHVRGMAYSLTRSENSARKRGSSEAPVKKHAKQLIETEFAAIELLSMLIWSARPSGSA